jgi:probable phosphoglycerate mutase
VAVYLVRHAEDLAHREGRLGDEDLSSEGRRQARALGARLSKVELRACLVSPLRRAGETARLVLEGREVPLEVDPNLAEGALGELEGLDRDDAGRRYPEDFRLGQGVVERIAATGRTAPGGESRDAFLARARAASQRVEQELASQGNVLVIAHGGLLNYLLQILLQIPLRDQVPFGFEHSGLVALRRAGTASAYGPFVSLRFGLQGADQGNL